MSLETILTAAQAKHIFPGAVVGICGPDSLEIIPIGRVTYDSDSPLVIATTRYDVASITKTIPTAYLIWKFIEFGKLSLEQSVQELLPEWKGKHKDQVLLWHLLAQTVRYESISLARLSSQGAPALLQHIREMELLEPPGTSYYYVNTNSILLGWILERVSGKNLQDLAEEYFWQPLEMQATGFFPQTAEHSSIAPTEQLKDGTLLQGKVHDESARVLSAKGKAVGSAGLFSTVPNLLRFLQMLLRQGEEVLRPETVEASWGTRTLTNGQTVGLGWEYNNPAWMGALGSDCYGKTGFTGGFCAVFPEEQRGIVMLSNAVHPQRPPERESLTTLRENLLEACFQRDLSPNS